MKEFSVGSKVVYPQYGVAEVVGVEKKEIGGNLQIFYILKILKSGIRVMIPTAKLKAAGMRSIISSTEADLVFESLRKKEKIVEPSTWNRRHREYMEKIKTGSVFEIAKVLKNLYLLKSAKELSFGERKVLDTAKSLLIKEISISKGLSSEEIENRFRSIFRI